MRRGADSVGADVKKYNLGWALLKLLMCYEVVMVHAWDAWACPGEGAWRLLEELVFPHVSVVPRSFSGGCLVFAVSFALVM